MSSMRNDASPWNSPSSSSASPYRKMRKEDNIAEEEEEATGSDVFEIPPKHAPFERLHRWRKATIALNACRKFRYTLDLHTRRTRGDKSSIVRFRVTVEAVRAAGRFRRYCLPSIDSGSAPPQGFEISVKALVSLVAEKKYTDLQHLGGVTEVARRLHTNPEKGFADDPLEIERRKRMFGSNTYPQKDVRNFAVFVWEASQDKTLIILAICAVLSLVFGIKTEGIKEGWLDGISILIAVLLVIFFTAISDYRQSLQFKNLNEEKRNIQVHVVRGGRRRGVSIFDLVVGDIVPLNIGNRVPADGILIQGHSLAIDESSMTGESEHVFVNQRNPFLKSGCKVVDGYGLMLVTAVGLNTEWGLLMASISEDHGGETPLQVRLNGVATFIGKLGLFVAVLVFLVLLVRLFTGNAKDSEGKVLFVPGKSGAEAALNGIVKIFAIAVTIVVVAVPEGLPLAVTLTLAYSMRKMMADKALVRRLSACETMGSATTICSDKTGTLTMNQMTIVRALLGTEFNDPPEFTESIPSLVLGLLMEGIANNTTGSVFRPEDGGDVEVTGSPTEKAILRWALELGMDFDSQRSKCSVLNIFTFNSEKKRGGVALKMAGEEVHIHWKGAAEIILNSCDTWIDNTGSVQSMSADMKYHFSEKIETMAASSLRCIAFAHRTYDLDSIPTHDEELQKWQLPENGLTLLGIVGIKDPCRPHVREAVRRCQSAGVKVRMVTGDNLHTAYSIALECGILQEGQSSEFPCVLEGRRFREIQDESLRSEIAENILVMGRSSPNDKLLLVQALKRNEHVVAVTGDGTNDASALHEADIGLSMGIQGTEVAKESSDIVILDDDFSSVVKVVRWGRSVYANIQKFIQFQLTVNVAALIINFVASISSGEVPLTAVQLLWVNLIMDTLGALALATEPPTDRLMERQPVGRKEPLVTNTMWRNLVGQALYQVTVLLVLQFKGNELLKLENETAGRANLVRNTVIFNAFVLCQIFNEFNSRKPEQINIFKGLLQSHLFLGIIGFTLLAQVLIVEFAGRVASTTKLNWKQWIICLVTGSISWPLAAAIKLIPVPKKPFSNYLSNRLRKRFPPLRLRKRFPPFNLNCCRKVTRESDCPDL
eukprot:TRINITY_DN704_c0_g4_i2.p1 TRINITY_DN704_c0_g4~~TRINITY_DN704_c0_g4_i2.p1  ORF type:complete len:1109 (-),score=145.86 TRINITY_DN704_c0_g4_i2:457-3783(-)